MKPSRRGYWAATRLGLVVLACAAVVVLVVLWPFYIGAIAQRKVDWTTPANMGEAYGGASALLSGLAFCGIAISLFVQWRQTQVSLIYSARQRHFELVRLALTDPRYLSVTDIYVEGDDTAPLKAYGSLVLNHWALLWDLGLMDEAAIRRDAAKLFQNPMMYKWWATTGGQWQTGRSSRRNRFMRLLNDEYRLASANPDRAVNVTTLIDEEARNVPRHLLYVVAGTVLGLAIAGVASRVVSRRRQRKGLNHAGGNTERTENRVEPVGTSS